MSQTCIASVRPESADGAWWDEGRRTGRQVTILAALASVSAAALNVALTGTLSLFYDLTLVVVCLVAALAVRPRDFFTVGVLPPLLLLGTVTLLALSGRQILGDPADGVRQSVVSGLAHHAGGLVSASAVALVILALRQLALHGARQTRRYA